MFDRAAVHPSVAGIAGCSRRGVAWSMTKDQANVKGVLEMNRTGRPIEDGPPQTFTPNRKRCQIRSGKSTQQASDPDGARTVHAR